MWETVLKKQYSRYRLSSFAKGKIPVDFEEWKKNKN